MGQRNSLSSLVLTAVVLLLFIVGSSAHNHTTAGNPVAESACVYSAQQTTTILTTDIKYSYQFLLTASLSNVPFRPELEDPDSTLFKSTADAFENEINNRLGPLIQTPPPSTVSTALDAAVILFRTSDQGQPNGLTLECVLSTDSDQITALFLSSQLQTVASSSADYPNFIFRVSASVNYCLREVILTQEGAITWPVSPVGMETGTEELCPVGTKYVGERPLGRRSCSRTPGSQGHAQWEPYVCTDCGQIILVDDALEAIYNEIRQKSSVVLDGVMRAAELLNEVTDITEVGFKWVSLILEYISSLGMISTWLLDAVMRLLSNLLQQESRTFFLAEQQFSSSTRIIQSLASILKNTALTGSTMEYASVHPNVAASLLDVSQSRIQEEWISFGSVVGAIPDAPLNEGTVGLLTGRTLSLLPNSEAYVHIKVQGPVSTDTATVRTVFAVYHNAKLFQSTDPQVSTTPTIAGRVVSADIRASQSPALSVITRFKPLEPRVTNVECRSWSPSLNNGHGDWSAPACSRDDTETSDRVKCQCSQLAAFTIFAESSTGGTDSTNGINAFVRMGAVICMLCLLAAVVLYIIVKELRTRREVQILCFLFLVLAAFYLILTAGIDQSGPACIVVGALLHYCILAAFGWMGVAWIHLYDLSRRRAWSVTWFLAKVSGLVWGIPFVFVSVTVLVDPYHYITPTQRCFLSSDPIYNLVIALILPVLLILVAMGVAFGFTARNVILDNEAKPDLDPEGMVNDQGPSRRAKFWKLWQKYVFYTALIALTTLTFIFAIVMANNSSGGAEYIFGFLALFNGVLVVVAFCVYHRDIRETMLIKLGYLNGPDGRKFQPYWSTSKWQRNNQQSVIPEAETTSESNGKNLYLDDTQGSGAQTNQGFNPTTIPLSTIEMQRMGENGVKSHTNNGIVVKADYRGASEEAEARL